jgi:hypothetical protein
MLRNTIIKIFTKIALSKTLKYFSPVYSSIVGNSFTFKNIIGTGIAILPQTHKGLKINKE